MKVGRSVEISGPMAEGGEKHQKENGGAGEDFPFQDGIRHIQMI